MSYYVIKNIRIKKKENKISADVADSSFRDYDNKYIYQHCDDLFELTRGADIEDKKAFLIYDIIVGTYHVHNGKAYKNLECTFDYLEDFVRDFRKAIEEHRTNDYKLIYNAYKDEIESWLVNDCVVKDPNSGYYIRKINKKTIGLNYRSYAKEFNSKYVEHKTALLQNGYEIEKITEGSAK